MRGARLGVFFVATVVVWAGCAAPVEEKDPKQTVYAGGRAAPLPSANGFDATKLTQPIFEVLPKTRHYIQAKTQGDNIRLYLEAFLPKGDGPWPTILINSPYYDHGVSASNDVEAGFRGYFVPRGYAVVVADVRGTGYSEGCMNMMGAKEQKDTYDLVEWIAAQSWSDGKVGMYGVSYVGTTPHEALIMAPPHLVTVVTVAGVTNQWRNTFQNGVPYANRHYPLTYEVLEGAPPPTDVERGPDFVLNAAAAACEQDPAIKAMSPGTYEKGVYDAYWAERNFTTKVAGATASLFYNQGFTDRAVNPMESIYWFNDLPVTKKAFFGQWAHRTPLRKDWQDTLNGWFDHWLKGIDNGIMSTPTVEVIGNTGKVRTGTEWPPADAVPTRLYLSPGKLGTDVPSASRQTYTADFAYRGGTTEDPAQGALNQVRATYLSYVSDPLEEDLYMAGIPWAHLRASSNQENTYFLLSLYDVEGTLRREVAEGWMNAHLHQSFDKSTPLRPGEAQWFHFKFEPREYLFQKGHRIEVQIKGHDSRVMPFDKPTSENTVLMGGEDASHIELPVLADPVLFPPGPNI